MNAPQHIHQVGMKWTDPILDVEFTIEALAGHQEFYGDLVPMYDVSSSDNYGFSASVENVTVTMAETAIGN